MLEGEREEQKEKEKEEQFLLAMCTFTYSVHIGVFMSRATVVGVGRFDCFLYSFWAHVMHSNEINTVLAALWHCGCECALIATVLARSLLLHRVRFHGKGSFLFSIEERREEEDDEPGLKWRERRRRVVMMPLRRGLHRNAILVVFRSFTSCVFLPLERSFDVYWVHLVDQ